MISDEKQFTPAGNLRKPRLQQVCEWTVTAWESIPAEMIIKSFKKCGISNAMDGSKDDELYADLVSGDNSETETPDSVDDEELGDYYDDIPLSDLQIRLLFEDDDDDVEFLGFASIDIVRE